MTTYSGFLVPDWPNGIDQRSALVGSIVRTIPHPTGPNNKSTAPAGVVAQLDNYTLVESCALGWWYSTYLPSRQLVVTLMTDSDIAREQGMLTEPGWLSVLKMTQQSYSRLINAEPLTSIKAKPAHSQYLKPVCGTAWYAVGDAAATFDPLSSLGIFKALRHGLIVSYAIDDFIQGKTRQREKISTIDGDGIPALSKNAS